MTTPPPPAAAGDTPGDPHTGEQPAEVQRAGDLTDIELHDLRRLVASQPVIEQAKGIMMACYRCGPESAFAILRRLSGRAGVPLRDVAALVVRRASDLPLPDSASGPGSGWNPVDDVLAEVATGRGAGEGAR